MQKVKFHPKVYLAYSEIGEGNTDKRFSSPEIYKANRKELLKLMGINTHQLIEGEQIHSARILRLDHENTQMWRGQNIIGVDGFVTDQTDVYMMLRVADCVPLVIYDPEHRALGIIHAGWRGTVSEIHLKGLALMIKIYGTNPKTCLVWFGPSARSSSFYTTESPEQKLDPLWKSYIKKRKGRWYVDFMTYQIDTLKNAGVYKKNMIIDPRCTVTDKNLFSHLRSKETLEPQGRFAVVARLLP
jgi:hypothetical protein